MVARIYQLMGVEAGICKGTSC